MATSPSTDNYQIGKGNVYFQKGELGDFRHVGNVSEFEWSPTVEKLDHFSSMEGIRKKDKSVVVEAGATLRMVMDEITAANLELMLLGTIEQDSDGNSVIESMTEESISGIVKFIGANQVGLQMEFIGKVEFTPSGSFNLISEEWNTLEVTGEMVSHDDYGLGRMLIKDAA